MNPNKDSQKMFILSPQAVVTRRSELKLPYIGLEPVDGIYWYNAFPI